MSVGQTFESLTKPALSKEQLVDYAHASGDVNPIHLDDSVAGDAGFPSVIAHGMISMAFLADYLRKLIPENEYRVSRFRVRFKKVAFPGDRLTCEGKVKAVLPTGTTVIWVSAVNQNGELVTEGEAEIAPVSS